jgi:arginase
MPPPAIEVIGVPFNSSGTPDGVARAPEALRAAGLLEGLRQAEVVDAGDLELPPPTTARSAQTRLQNEGALIAAMLGARERVRTSIASGRFPLVLGGDDAALPGWLAGARDAAGDGGLLFVDGHEDAWPPPRSPTGEAADSDLGFALGLLADHAPAELRELLPVVSPDATALLGPRDAGEIAAAGIPSLADRVRVIPDRAVPGDDVASLTRRELDRIRAVTKRWWLHVDLDVLSTDALRAVDYLQPGGLDWTDLDELTRAALATEGCVGWSVVDYNPDLDPNGAAAERIIEYVKAAAAWLCGPSHTAG